MKSLRLVIFLCAIVVGVLVLSPVAAQEIPTSLPLGGTLQQFVDTVNRSHQYQFGARQDESVFLLVVSDEYDNAPAIVISDAVTNENIATAKTAVSAVCMRFGPGSQSYNMNISADSPNGSQWYGVALASGDPTALSCPEEFVNTFINGFSAAKNGQNGLTLGSGLGSGLGGGSVDCVASSGANVGVNVRSGDSSTAPIIGSVGVDSLVPVMGVTTDAERLLVDLTNGNYGFAVGDILTISGDCSTVPTITVDGTTVNGTGSLLDLNGIINPDTNIGGLDLGAVTDLAGLDTTGLTDLANLTDLTNLTDLGGVGTGDLTDLGGLDTGGVTDLNLLSVDTNGSADGNDVGLNLGTGDGDSFIEVSSDTNADSGSGGGTILDVNAGGNDVVDASSGADGSTNTCINALGIEILC